MIVALLACSGEDDTGAGSEWPQETGVMIAAPDLPAELAAEDIDATIEELIATELFLPYEVHTWFMGVFADLEAGTGSCPSEEPTEGEEGRWASFWSGTCTGARYSVFGNWLLDVTETTAEGTYSLDAVELWSFTGETLPDGGELAGGGQSVVKWSQAGGEVSLQMDTLGTFVDAAGPEPLQDGIAPGITLIGTWTMEAGYVGELSGPLGSGETALDFEELVFAADCGSPSGIVRVRDPSSQWWEITLSDDCSGCGPLSYDGVEQGESCPGALIRDTINGRFGNYYESNL